MFINRILGKEDKIRFDIMPAAVFTLSRGWFCWFVRRFLQERWYKNILSKERFLPL